MDDDRIMKTFDAEDGTTWKIHITAGTLLRIKTQCDIDLLNNPLELPVGIEELVGLFWAVVQPQAQTSGISATQFGEGLGASQLVEATDIFVAELVFFFMALGQQPKAMLLKKTWQMLKSHNQETARKVTETLGEIYSD